MVSSIRTLPFVLNSFAYTKNSTQENPSQENWKIQHIAIDKNLTYENSTQKTKHTFAFYIYLGSKVENY